MLTPNQRLQQIKLEMGRKGWTNGGEPGGFKLNTYGMTVAIAGEREWIEDMEAAMAHVDDREKAKDALGELRRRGVLDEGGPGFDEAGAEEEAFEARVSRR
jgi:hypothetical protein